MNPIILVYNEALFRPLFNLLVGITNILPGHGVGLSIIIVTILVRLILFPLALHQARQMQSNQSKMGELKKELAKINHQHKDDKAKKAEATMKLYKEAGVNPASGCLPLIIQLPILIALYRVFLIGLGSDTWQYLYSFVGRPEVQQMAFLGIDLSRTSLLLAVIAGAGQFVLMKMSTLGTPAQPSANDDTAQMMSSMQKNMAYIFPAMTIFISLQLPAALALYWVASTFFGIVQQYSFKKYLNVSSSTPI